MIFGKNMKCKYFLISFKETVVLQFINKKLQICLQCNLQEECQVFVFLRTKK